MAILLIQYLEIDNNLICNYPNLVQYFGKYYINSSKITKDFWSFAKMEKFCQIWSQWLLRMGRPQILLCHSSSRYFIHFPESGASLTPSSVPTIVGLSLCLSILALLLCFMFKLFSRSRWARSRGYADANAPPPTITLEGQSIDV